MVQLTHFRSIVPNNTPKEKVLEDWEKSKEWDDVGITVDEFIVLQQQKINK